MTAKVTFNSDRCKGCELCTTVCPKHIVAIDQAVINRKGYHPAHVTDISQCIACASCAKICPDSLWKNSEKEVIDRGKRTLERK